MFSLIAAIGKNRELGRRGELLFRIPEDMKFFKDMTLRHKIVMGRKTWESLPGKLQGRENIVVSHHEVPGADLSISDVEAFIEENRDTEEEVFVIGGGAIYAKFLPYAKMIYLTEVDIGVPDADTFFPEYDFKKYDREVIKSGGYRGKKYEIVKLKLKEENERPSI